MDAKSQLWQNMFKQSDKASKEYIKGLANTDASLLNGRVTACDRPAGLQAAVRDHSWYNESLYDDIMAEFQPLTNKDILVISYGGWYERFQWDTAQVPFLCLRSQLMFSCVCLPFQLWCSYGAPLMRRFNRNRSA